MKLYQRACMVLAQEGVKGLSQRVVRKYLGTKAVPPPVPREDAELLRQVAAAKEDYGRLRQHFVSETTQRGYGDLSSYYWYHTIDLGGGLTTPGDFDFRDHLDEFHFPADMSGMNVLDVGAATGFFSFEFERRGATVVSVDLPSLADWDILRRDREEELRALGQWHGTAQQDDTYNHHLDGPFLFCRKMLHSNVRRCYSTVYDLTTTKLGVDGFDLVFLGDVIPHIFSPLEALDALAALCKGTLVVCQRLWEQDYGGPAMCFMGGDEHADTRSWWLPNRACLEQMLRRVGFKDVRLVGRHRDILRRHWYPIDRAVLHARK